MESTIACFVDLMGSISDPLCRLQIGPLIPCRTLKQILQSSTVVISVKIMLQNISPVPFIPLVERQQKYELLACCFASEIV
jgi:hypothetical protein